MNDGSWLVHFVQCSNLMLIESIPREPLGFHLVPFDCPRVQYTLQVSQHCNNVTPGQCCVYILQLHIVQIIMLYHSYDVCFNVYHQLFDTVCKIQLSISLKSLLDHGPTQVYRKNVCKRLHVCISVNGSVYFSSYSISFLHLQNVLTLIPRMRLFSINNFS